MGFCIAWCGSFDVPVIFTVQVFSFENGQPRFLVLLKQKHTHRFEAAQVASVSPAKHPFFSLNPTLPDTNDDQFKSQATPSFFILHDTWKHLFPFSPTPLPP